MVGNSLLQLQVLHYAFPVLQKRYCYNRYNVTFISLSNIYETHKKRRLF